jgi:prolipoprotein diacylglyceryltransferase
VFTLSQRKIDFILGVIGGVFVFWYAIVRFIGHAYNRLNFSLVVAREIYDE